MDFIKLAKIDGVVKSPIYGVVVFFQTLGIPKCIASPLKKHDALYMSATGGLLSHQR